MLFVNFWLKQLMKKIIFALLLLFTSNSVLFSQKFQIIENEYITSNYLTNGMIFMKTKFITQKHRVIIADYNDPYAPWHHMKLISSSIPIIYSEGRIQVNLNEINRENHKLILTFSDMRDLCQTRDTIDLPYITNIYLNNKNFIVNEENIISYDIKLNNGTIISNSYSLLDKNDLCPCNKNDFKFENEKLIPIYNIKKNTLNSTLCLMRKSNGEIVFNEEVELTFKNITSLDFSGKNGISGKRGIDGTATSSNGTAGQNGENGENAPNVSVFINHILVNGDSVLQVEAFSTNGQYFTDLAAKNAQIKILANGGKGGNGANGGDGDNLTSYTDGDGSSVYRKAGSGGNGGNSGSGGNGGGIIVYSYQNFNEDKLIYENNGGKAGNIGKYGANGNGYSSTYNNTTGGSSGADGSNGKNGNMSKFIKLSQEDYNKLYQEKLKKMFD